MKKLKNERGAITIIVLVSMLFFTTFLVSAYLILANKSQSQVEITKQIQEIYDNSNSIEDIYNSYFERDVDQNYTIDDYVQTDLILWLDGIENTRSGHSNSTATWQDLSGNNDDIALSNVTWDEISAIFNGTNSYGIGSKGNFTKGCTIEVVFKIDSNPSYAYGIAGYSSTTANAHRPNIFVSSGPYVSASMSTNGATMALESNISINIEEINYTTLTALKFLVDGETYTHTNSITDAYTTTNRFAVGRYWGADDTAFWDNSVLNGNIYAIRVYDRNLTNEEITKNYKIDQYRFENHDEYPKNNTVPIYTVEQLLKIGSNENIAINEIGGKIYNFGQDKDYILMNDLEFDVDDYTSILGNSGWTPVGDTAIKFEGNNHKILVTQIDDYDRVYTKENKYSKYYYTIDDYVKTDLILWLDGIENTRSGHSNSTATWQDLSGNNDDVTLSNVTWNTTSAMFNGTNSYGIGAKGYFTKGCTIEVVFKIDSNPSYAYGIAGYSSTTANAHRPNIFVSSGPYVSASMSTNGATMALESNISINIGEINYTTLTALKFLVNGETYTHTNSITDAYTTTNRFAVGRYWGADDTAFWDNSVLNGNIYAIRVYDRNLTNEEITKNYTVDQYRFNLE